MMTCESIGNYNFLDRQMAWKAGNIYVSKHAAIYDVPFKMGPPKWMHQKKTRPKAIENIQSRQVHNRIVTSVYHFLLYTKSLISTFLCVVRKKVEQQKSLRTWTGEQKRTTKKKVGTRNMIIIDEQTSRIKDVKKREDPHRIYMAKRFWL